MTVYRSNSQLWRDDADADAARDILAAHVPVEETGLCAVCLVTGPCPPANAAANRLVELGRPLVPPHVPRRKRRPWTDWLSPHRRAAPHPAPLLTFGWQLRLDPLAVDRRVSGATS
ncbi:hypothetical protein ACI2K4_06870 [Micromonospora sp. NPDC050397]|uniref:hypothetical protein n=1 Tax=Micromonospora sp. NPDC050397 TaxID=3364279 RepID=UPI00385049FE